MQIDASEQIEKFKEFLHQEYEKKIYEAIRKGTYVLNIDFLHIMEFDHELADQLLEEPEETIKAIELAIESFDIDKSIRARIFNLPVSQFIMVRDIRSSHLGKFMFTDGIVRQSSDVRPQVTSAKFECPSCGNNITILQLDTRFKEPSRCSCGRKGKFRLISKELVDAQRLVIEEVPESLEGGEQPKRLSIFLKEDLVEPKMEKKTTPGSKIRVTGIVKEVPIVLKTGAQSIRYDLMMESNYIQPIEETFSDIDINEEEENKIKELAKDPQIYEKLTNAIAPSIYGHDRVKEAIILQLMGGVRKIKEDGTVTRGDLHVLLVGDPGSGKSQILMFVSKSAPKARFISGKGASGAGITASVVKDEFLRGWALEAGALVLANGGTACLHPDTEVIVDDKIKSIKEIFQNKSTLTINNNQINESMIKVPVINKNNLEVHNAIATKIRRKQYKGQLINLQLDSGFSIKLTPDHKIIDGNSLLWKQTKDFRVGDHVLAPLKLPNHKQSLYFLNIVPPSWKISLDKKEKHELKKSIKKKFTKLTEFNKIFKIDRNYLSGGKQLTVSKFKEIINYLNEYNKWKLRNLTYTRKSKGEKLKINEFTTELCYILGFSFGDGHVKLNKRRGLIRITQTLAHKPYINKLIHYWKKVSTKPLKLSIRDKKETIIRGKKCKSNKHYVLYCGSNLLAQLYFFLCNDLNNLFLLPKDSLRAFISGCIDSDGYIGIKKYYKNSKTYKINHAEIQISNNLKMNLNLILALRQLDVYGKIKIKRNRKVISITGRKDVLELKTNIKKYSIKAKKISISKRKNAISSTSDKLPSEIVANICKKISELNKTELINKGIWSTIYNYKNKDIRPSRDQIIRIKNLLKNKLDNEVLKSIDILNKRDFFLDKIISIKKEYYNGYVYDLYVPEKHNFVANGIFVHNCIDELDKMSPEDRSAMHEAMEQQQVSISKANIQATLMAKTTILAAANPKLGRFDPYTPIASQIDLPPTLINRFDLIFPIRDIPNKDLDEKIASHVLKLQQTPEKIKTEIPTSLLRKYIAYARQKISPVLTDSAVDEIKRFYVALRNTGQTGEEEIKPIPISARQLEALVRLAEGSARLRLSKKVTRQDAKRAITLLKHCLMQVGIDPETGKIDIDRISTGIPASQRSRIVVVREIIRSLEEKIGKSIPISDIIAEASLKGIDEAQVEEAIEKLSREGFIFQPKRDTVSVVD